MEPLKKRGGKREGAGRKPLSADLKRITGSVNLEQAAWDKLKAKASQSKASVSEIINRWAKRLKP